MKTLKVLASNWPSDKKINGMITFQEDMLRSVIPLLSDIYDVRVEYQWDKFMGRYPADIVYGLCSPPSLDCREGQRFFWHAHNNYESAWSKERIDEVSSKMKLLGTLIYHTKQSEEFFKGFGDAVFFPMCIDIQALPVMVLPRNGRWMYYGNRLTEEVNKSKTLAMIQDKFPQLDILSNGILNGDKSKVYTRKEGLELISNYSYGVGVGRSLLEMLSMGLKCICAGSWYGGPILSRDDFEKHWVYNCNGTQATGTSFKNDVKSLIDSTYTFDPTLVDIRQYAPKLIEQFGRSL